MDGVLQLSGLQLADSLPSLSLNRLSPIEVDLQCDEACALKDDGVLDWLSETDDEVSDGGGKILVENTDISGQSRGE